MYTSSLKYSHTLDTGFLRLMSLPGVSWFAPNYFSKTVLRYFTKYLLEMIGIQYSIKDISVTEAIELRKEFKSILNVLNRLRKQPSETNPVRLELYETSDKLIKKLNENIFLMTLIIDAELEPSDRLPDLLEDYYDGLLIDSIKDQPTYLYEDVRQGLFTKHGLV